MFVSSSERPTPRDFVILFMGFSFTKLLVADSHSEKFQNIKVDLILMGSRYSVRRSGIINFLCAVVGRCVCMDTSYLLLLCA
jgi:hypothetical protein